MSHGPTSPVNPVELALLNEIRREFEYEAAAAMIETMARRLGKTERWVNNRLTGRARLTFKDAASLAMVLGYELHPRLEG